MPYTRKQNKVFRAIAHGWHPNKGSLASISQGEAAKMAAEGVKHRKMRKQLHVESTTG